MTGVHFLRACRTLLMHAHWHQGCGVLDVAGGKGQLSFELLNLKGVPTTVVDPRPLNVDKYSASFRMGHYGRQPEGATPRAPRHIQRFWEPQLWAPHDPVPDVYRQLKDAWERAHGNELLREGRSEGALPADPAANQRSGERALSEQAELKASPANLADEVQPEKSEEAGAATRELLEGVAEDSAQKTGPAGPASPGTGECGALRGQIGEAGQGEQAAGSVLGGGRNGKVKVKPRFRGVYFDAMARGGEGGDVACIRVGGERRNLGVCGTEEDAAALYDRAATEVDVYARAHTHTHTHTRTHNDV